MAWWTLYRRCIIHRACNGKKSPGYPSSPSTYRPSHTASPSPLRVIFAPILQYQQIIPGRRLLLLNPLGRVCGHAPPVCQPHTGDVSTCRIPSSRVSLTVTAFQIHLISFIFAYFVQFHAVIAHGFYLGIALRYVLLCVVCRCIGTLQLISY